jgi:hypothetical protein
LALACTAAVWHGRGMARRNARAGGIYLMILILGGFAWGVATGQAMLGVLAGTALGVAAALLFWLLDRRR